MKTRDLYWAAGLIEGEGYFAKARPRLEKREGKGKSRGRTQVYVSVEMADEVPVLKLHCLFGGSVSYRKPRKAGWAGTYVWRVGGVRAREVALTLYVLMSPRRRRQIREALL